MITYTTNTAGILTIKDHLECCSSSFISPLSFRVDLFDYASKLSRNAYRFEAWEDGILIGLLAVYEKAWFITNVSVLPSHRRFGIAEELILSCASHAKRNGAAALDLRVGKDNLPALIFYEKFAFRMIGGPVNGEYTMRAELDYPPRERDFNIETHDTPTAKYTYSFDMRVMHPMMVRTFEPWFVDSPWIVESTPGNCLELGSFEGAFTKRLHEYFSDITCVEASAEAFCKHMREQPHTCGNLSTFEKVDLKGKQYDNIFMTHVLEHVENPVRVLKRVNDEWLAPGSRFFLACPNANAASRQIAVKMDLIPFGTATTNDERQHGHFRTYALDTLELDAKMAGLKVLHRGGIFFKALANFQLDKAKAAGIIDDAYLEGCYALGQVYPDLCASIYLICENGEAK